jgi:hypothetical protein
MILTRRKQVFEAMQSYAASDIQEFNIFPGGGKGVVVSKKTER